MQFRVQIATYNGHLGQYANMQTPDQLAAWLVPTLQEGSAEYPSEGEPPDFFAVGFQEMIPLTHDDLIQRIIEKHVEYVKNSPGEPEKYTLLAKKALGGIALLVYARDKTVTERVTQIDIATAACGVFNLMGNKGAVGARVVIEETSVFTFVSAHLAAHDSGVQRRNEDYKTIVERLVFEPSDDPARYQIYDTSYLFFFGDLNYRIAGKAFGISQLTSLLEQNDIETLLAQDQLKHEQRLGNTLHYLKEGDITFKPTYKFIPGTDSEYSNFNKRVPGWCDRILHATYKDDPDSTASAAQVELYRSVMSFTESDHKPITTIILLPPCDTAELKHLPFSAPFGISESYKTSQLLGWILDRVVGTLWSVLYLAGFGKDARIGVFTLSAVFLAAWYYRH